VIQSYSYRKPLSGWQLRAGPSGIYMFKRSIGLNILLDEVQVPAVLWASVPRQISIALTNACDLSCSYCYAPKIPAILDAEKVASWLTELDSEGCVGVNFGGGEPTLHRHFADLCHFTVHHTNMAVTFTTNSFQLDDKLLAALVGNVQFVRISMDGIGATYEELRGRPFMELYHRLENVHILAPFGINFVVNARTLPDLDAATSLAANLGASEFLLLPEQPVNGRSGFDHRTAHSFRSWVARYQGEVPLVVSEAGSDGLGVCDPFAGETGLRTYAHIDANGIIKRSSFATAGVAIGTGGVIRALEKLKNQQEERHL